jgi:hypothetical protein
MYPFVACEQQATARQSFATLVSSNKYAYGAVVLLHSMMKTGGCCCCCCCCCC